MHSWLTKQKSHEIFRFHGIFWCDGRDSNPRPTDSQEPNGTFCPFHHLTLKRHFNRISVILPLLFCCILCIACTSLHLLSILAMCRKCAKVCRAKISPAKQAVSHSPQKLDFNGIYCAKSSSFIQTTILHDTPVLWQGLGHPNRHRLI